MEVHCAIEGLNEICQMLYASANVRIVDICEGLDPRARASEVPMPHSHDQVDDEHAKDIPLQQAIRGLSPLTDTEGRGESLTEPIRVKAP